MYETVRLPWDLPISIWPKEALSFVIRRPGVYELPICECISRPLDPGEVALDVGENIGQLASIMAMRTGPSGEVTACEPQPVLFGELQCNIAVWEESLHVVPIAAHNLALSDHVGTATLMARAYFEPAVTWSL